jgi:hypothetical protein
VRERCLYSWRGERLDLVGAAGDAGVCRSSHGLRAQRELLVQRSMCVCVGGGTCVSLRVLRAVWPSNASRLIRAAGCCRLQHAAGCRLQALHVPQLLQRACSTAVCLP